MELKLGADLNEIARVV